MEKLSTAPVELRKQNNELEEQLVSVTKQLEDQLERPAVAVEAIPETCQQVWAQSLEEQVTEFMEANIAKMEEWKMTTQALSEEL